MRLRFFQTGVCNLCKRRIRVGRNVADGAHKVPEMVSLARWYQKYFEELP